MADQSGAAMAPSSIGGGMREYRKGNWTLLETMILIEAKNMDDQRRLKRSTTEQPGSSSQPEMAMTMRHTSSSSNKQSGGELRWKWVEDYCWRRGCFRSQNQCNDKWDNLMRDYKKVRDYQRNLLVNATATSVGGMASSYWNMERSERKERGLPSNILPTIYDALAQVVEQKSSPSPAALLPPPPATSTTAADLQQSTKPTTSGTLSLLLQQQQHMTAPALPPPFSSQPISNIPPPTTIPADSLLDSDTSSDSPAKRRRKDKKPAAASPAVDVASAICKISEAIQESEKRRDQRHRETLVLKQRRLQIEESSMEVNRQGMSGLVDAINNLANSIVALAASNSGSGQRPPPG